MKNKQNININKSSDIKIGSINFNAGPHDNDSEENSSKQNALNKEKIKKKIAKNELKEVVKTLLEKNMLTENESNLLYSIFYRINSLEDKIGKGIVSHDESSIERNKIASSLIEFVDKLND